MSVLTQLNPTNIWEFFRNFALAFGVITIPLIAGDAMHGVRREAAKKFAWKVFRICTYIAIADLLIGKYIPAAFGLPIGAFQAAGGVIFLIDAFVKLLKDPEFEIDLEPDISPRWSWLMPRKRLEKLRAEAIEHQRKRHQEEREASLMRQAAIPVAFPKFAGAGFLASILTAEEKSNVWHDINLWLGMVALLLVVLFALLCTPRIMGRLSRNGRLIFDKVAAFVLLLLGINGTLSGATKIILGVIQASGRA